MEAHLDRKKVAFMLGFFSLTTPLGIAIGIGASRSYDPESTTALGVQGTLNALAAGILIYLALVDMVAHEFSSPKVRGRVGHQAVMFMALVLGAVIMTGLASFE
jgi:zinc transporter 1/2/3